MALWSALFVRPSRLETPVRPSRSLFFWLVGTFVLTLLPHVEELPVWVMGVVLLSLAVRSLLEWYRIPLPSVWTTGILAICLFVAIYRQYETVLGRDAGTAFTVGLLALKFYELRGPRDAAMIIFSSMFVVMSALLYSQALELFIYCLIMMWLLTAALLRTSMGDRAEHQLLRMLRLSGAIFVQALPLAVFFFFFLPRYTGKFQMVLNDSPVGLTDRLEPGSISRLADNDDLAMYVRFTSNADLPTVDTMYWRAAVLWDYHKGAWTPGSLAVPHALPLPAHDSQPIDQEITIWPHNQHWLFALDYPVTKAVNNSEPDNWSTTLYGGVVQLGYWGAKLDHKERYTVTSSMELADQVLAPKSADYSAGTELPKDDEKDAIDPRVRALADQLHRDNPDTQAYIGAVLHYFRHEHFVYSKSPGTLPGDWLPTFLFETKAGFCEHYASSFGVLMRLEHIPARVVVGYQGAEYNPYDGLYTVRQSNAHSWDEVWIEAKKHWVRIDPTAILLIGADSPMAASGASGADDSVSIQVAQQRVTFSESYLPEWARHTLNDLQLRRQQVEADWDDWVFSYDPETQTRLADALGMKTGTLLLACLVATAICFFILQRLMRPRTFISPVEDVYAKFCRSMAQRGFPRAKWEGPLAYTERMAETFPDKKEAIHDFGAIVAHSRYGATPLDPSTPKELQALLNQITVAQAATPPDEGP